MRRQLRAALEQAFLPVDVQRRESGRAWRRMRRVGIAVEDFDRALGRGADDRVVYTLADRHGPHRLRAVGDALRHRHQVGRRAEALRGERLAGTAEAADNFVEHQQNAVRVADLPQSLQVTLRRHQHAGRAGDRLDEAGSDVLGAVQIDEAHPDRRPARRHALLRQRPNMVFSLLQMRVPHVDHARQGRAEAAPVVYHAGQRDAAEIDTVVGAFARDEHVTAALAARLVVGERDLHRGVDRLRARIDEEDAVKVTRRQLGHARRELERL